MNQDLKWYAIYTRPKWEKKVAERFSKKEIEHYCPLNQVYRQWSDRKKLILEPLFTSYVFIHVSEKDHMKILQTEGVINLVYWLGKPAVIKDDEIAAIKSFLNEHSNVQLGKVHVNVNDRVKIIHGPLVSREGDVVEVMNNTVKVVLPSLGYILVAQVQRSNIEKIVRKVDYGFNSQEKMLH